MEPILEQASAGQEAVASGAGLASCSVEVTLPLRVSQKWVSYACRTAGVSKPRWNRVRSTWLATAVGEHGAVEAIAITSARSGMSIRIAAEWQAPPGAPPETDTVRRLATAFVTTMRDSMRRRSLIRETIAELSRTSLS